MFTYSVKKKSFFFSSLPFLLSSLLPGLNSLSGDPSLVFNLSCSAALQLQGVSWDSNHGPLHGRLWPYHWAINTFTSTLLFFGGISSLILVVFKSNTNWPERNPWMDQDWTRAPPKTRTLEHNDLDESYWANALHLLSQMILRMKEWMKT